MAKVADIYRKAGIIQGYLVMALEYTNPTASKQMVNAALTVATEIRLALAPKENDVT